MTVMLILLIVLLQLGRPAVSQGPPCGEFPAEYKSTPTSEVAGGYEADGPWPWLVRLMISFRNKTNGHISKYSCGATIINSNYLITASHCVLPEPGSKQTLVMIEAWFNTFDLASDKEKNHFSMAIEPKNVREHEKFSYERQGEQEGVYDIALLKLTKRLNFAGIDQQESLTRPVCMPSNDPLVTSRQAINEHFCKIVGWGDTDELDEKHGGKTVKKLREGDVSILPDKRCSRKIQIDTRLQLCAGRPRDEDERKEVSSCSGDSGGGLYCQSRLGQWYLLGIVSGGYDCGFDGEPSKFARVRSFLDWIASQTQPKKRHDYGYDEIKNFDSQISFKQNTHDNDDDDNRKDSDKSDSSMEQNEQEQAEKRNKIKSKFSYQPLEISNRPEVISAKPKRVQRRRDDDNENKKDPNNSNEESKEQEEKRKEEKPEKESSYQPLEISHRSELIRAKQHRRDDDSNDDKMPERVWWQPLIRENKTSLYRLHNSDS